MPRLVPLVAAAALAVAAPAAAFTPSDPLTPKQWYLTDDHAFDAWPTPPQPPAAVRVAIVDSGVDCTLPDFQGQIAEKRSFVGGDPCVDTEGHGTFVAGEIAAAAGNGQGIAGVGLNARLVVAKVVGGDQSIDPLTEARAIQWEVDKGARVINLSLGATRDPLDSTVDTYSPGATAPQVAAG